MAAQTHWTKFRQGVFDHEKTRGLGPIAFALYWLINEVPYWGVLQQSPSMMARRITSGFVGDNVVEATDVTLGLSRLQGRGLIQWWPDLETAWVVERADENIAAGEINTWVAAQKQWAAYPQVVRIAIKDRYSELGTYEPKPRGSGSPSARGSGRGSPSPSPTPSAIPSPTPSRGDPMDPPCIATAIGTVSVLDTEKKEYADCAVVRDAMSRIKPTGMFPLLAYDEKIMALLRAGETPEGIIATVQRLADAVDSGTEPKEHWKSVYVFSGWYEKVRQIGASARKDLEL